MLGLVVFVMRMWIPESPRWLMVHGRPHEAERIMQDIEKHARFAPERDGDLPAIKAVGVIHQRRVAGFAHLGENLRDRLLQLPVNPDLHGEQRAQPRFEIGGPGIE